MDFLSHVDEDRNCYLVGSILSGEHITQESHPLNNREAHIIITSRSSDFRTEYVPFVWNDKAKIYTKGTKYSNLLLVPLYIRRQGLYSEISCLRYIIRRKS